MPDKDIIDQRAKQLKTFLELMQESLTQKDFLEAFKKVIDFVKTMEARNQQEREGLVATLNETTLALKKGNEDIMKSELGGLKNKFLGMFSPSVLKVKNEFNTKMRDMTTQTSEAVAVIEKVNTRLGEIRSGRDADEEKIVERVLAGIPPPLEPEEFEHPKVESHRDELETLKGKDRLNVKAIDGLEELIKGLIPEPRRLGGGITDLGVKFAIGRLVQTETPSGDIDGANLTYTVLNSINAVLSFGINGEVIHDDEYTFANRTITFTTALPASLTGLAFRIVYV